MHKLPLKKILCISLVIVMLPLYPTENVARATAIVDTLSDLPGESAGHNSVMAWILDNKAWSLGCLAAFTGLCIMGLSYKKDDHAHEEGKNNGACSSTLGSQDHITHLIAIPCDDPERHAVVAMYMAKNPTQQA